MSAKRQIHSGVIEKKKKQIPSNVTQSGETNILIEPPESEIEQVTSLSTKRQLDTEELANSKLESCKKRKTFCVNI